MQPQVSCFEGGVSLAPDGTVPKHFRSNLPEVSTSNQGHSLNQGPLAYRAPFGLPRSPKMETENRRLLQHRDLISSSSPAKLDLSKFPPKKLKGAIKHAGSGVKIPKKAELGLRNNNKGGKVRTPQIVKAPPPSNSGSGKMCGSMAFAQRARGCDRSTDTWTVGDVMMTPKASTHNGGGRFGRLTSIEREATVSVDFSRPISTRAWECDDSTDDSLSFEEVDEMASPNGGGLVSEHLMVFRPPNPSLDGGESSDNEMEAGRDADCRPPKMSLGDFMSDSMDEIYDSHYMRDSEVNDSEFKQEGSVESENKTASTGPIMVSQQSTDLRRIGAVQDKLEYRYSGGSFDRGRDARYSGSTMCDVIPENRVQHQHVPMGKTHSACAGKNSIKSMHMWQTNRERGFGPHSTSFDVPPNQDFCTGSKSSSFAGSNSSFSNESRSSNGYRSASSSTRYRSASSVFEEFLSQADSMDMASKDADFEIVYRESTDSTTAKSRRNSFGLARKVLGVTVGVTTSAIMLVSGAVVAGVFRGNGESGEFGGDEETAEKNSPKWVSTEKVEMEGYPEDDGLDLA
ncbi:hypothetical protein BSKO_11636 [Bryopsis sp. KO-2023]|nr:hypothetical protein BSKO_11636 [Bryopsis sp. KO-2023]